MTKTRYFIQRVPIGNSPKIARMSRVFHYVKLSGTFIFGIADVSVGDMKLCDDCHLTLLLPSLFSTQPIKDFCDAQNMAAWFDALLPFGVTETDACQSVVTKVVSITGHRELLPDF